MRALSDGELGLVSGGSRCITKRKVVVNGCGRKAAKKPTRNGACKQQKKAPKRRVLCKPVLKRVICRPVILFCKRRAPVPM